MIHYNIWLRDHVKRLSNPPQIWFIGALSFADDLNLLSPNSIWLKVDVCEKYAEEYNISFNGSKSRVLCFKGRQCKISNRGIIVNDVLLNMSESAVHLGHHVCTNDKDHIVTVAKTVFGRHLIYLCQIMIIFIHFWMVSYLSNTVVPIMVYHYDHLRFTETDHC